MCFLQVCSEPYHHQYSSACCVIVTILDRRSHMEYPYVFRESVETFNLESLVIASGISF